MKVIIAAFILLLGLPADSEAASVPTAFSNTGSIISVGYVRGHYRGGGYVRGYYRRR